LNIGLLQSLSECYEGDIENVQLDRNRNV